MVWKKLTENGSVTDRANGFHGNTDSQLRQYRRDQRRINLQRTILKTIKDNNNVLTAINELNEIELREDEEIELSNMLVHCCGIADRYRRYYGRIGEVLCRSEIHRENLEKCFVERYYKSRWQGQILADTHKNLAEFFGHLCLKDAISWHVLEVVKLTPEENKNTSRNFLEVLFMRLADLGIEELKERFKDPAMYECFKPIFPLGSARDTKLAIEFFTTVGLEELTDDLKRYLFKRKYVKVAKLKLDYESSSSESDSGYSDEESEKEKNRRKKTRGNHIQIGGS